MRECQRQLIPCVRCASATDSIRHRTCDASVEESVEEPRVRCFRAKRQRQVPRALCVSAEERVPDCCTPLTPATLRVSTLSALKKFVFD
eukprot:3586348-Rhodomonas_salina.1